MEQWYIVCTYAVLLTLVICFSSQFHTNSKNKSHSQSHLHMWRGWNASMQLVNISSTTWVMIAHISTYALALNSSEMSRIWISSLMGIFILTVQISPKDDASSFYIFYCLLNITHTLNISTPWPPGDSIKPIDSMFLHLSASTYCLYCQNGKKMFYRFWGLNDYKKNNTS